MKIYKKIFAVLLAVTMLISFSMIGVPAGAADIRGSKYVVTHEGDPLHPDEIYLVGQQVHYELEIENTHATQSMTLDIWDVDPSGEVHVLATDVLILPGEIWSTDFHYIIMEGDLEPLDDFYVVKNHLFAEGSQGIEDVSLEVTKTVRVAQPDISVTKEASHDISKAGDTVMYTIRVTNTGDWDLEDITVYDELLGGDITAEFGFDATLAPGAWKEIVFPYVILEGDTNPLINQISVEGIGAGFDPELAGAVVTDSDSAEVDLVQPAFTIVKEADTEVSKTGDAVNYTVTLSNTGDVELELVVEDSMEGILFDSDVDGLLEVGATEVFNYQYIVQEGDYPGPLVNTVTAVATLGYLNLDNRYEEESSVEVLLVTPSILVTKTVDPAEAYVGDTVTFTIRIENIGDWALNNIVLNDSMFGDISAHFTDTLGIGEFDEYSFDYVILEGDIVDDEVVNTVRVDSNPVGLENEISNEDTATVVILEEDLMVEKTAVTSYIRTHEWDIDKSVETDYGLTTDELVPMIWLYPDGSGDETATWNVNVTYEGYEDSEYNVSGIITIMNTGDGDATILSVEDLLGGELIAVDFGVIFPYVLAQGETLEGTYSENGIFNGYNVVTVTTQRDEYTADAEIIWGDPDTEVNAIVDIKDTSDLFGEVHLGTLDASVLMEGEVVYFSYDHMFVWTDYTAEGPYIYNNTAMIVQTGQYAEATLVVNWEDQRCYANETAWAFGGENANENWDYANGNNWGWTNGPLSEGSYEFELWAAAGQNDLSNGTHVGTVYVEYIGGCVTVTYETFEGYYLDEIHLWIGNDVLPTRKTGYTNAPGQFPYGGKYDFEGGEMETSWTITMCDFVGDIYVAAHAVVWMEVDCPEMNDDIDEDDYNYTDEFDEGYKPEIDKEERSNGKEKSNMAKANSGAMNKNKK